MGKYNYGEEKPFAAFITNLGKYNEGYLEGEWLWFPTTREELAAVFKRIGIGSKDEFGVEYEEWFITDYDIYVDGIESGVLGEYPNLDELNYLATKLEELSEYELEVYESFVCEHGANIKDYINLAYTENLYNIDLFKGINNDYDLGYYFVEESGIYDTESMGSLTNYIDYESFGRDVRLDEGGYFSEYGYIRDLGNIDKLYSGVEEIPGDICVLSSRTEELKEEEPPKIDYKQIAEELERFAYETGDTYEYMDRVEDRIDTIEEIKASLKEGKIDGFVQYLNDFLSEPINEASSFKPKAEELLRKLDDIFLEHHDKKEDDLEL